MWVSPCMDTGGIAQHEWSISLGLIHSFLPSPHSQAPPERGRGLARGLAGGLPAALGRRSSWDPALRGQPADGSHDALGGRMVDLGSLGRRFCWGFLWPLRSQLATGPWALGRMSPLSLQAVVPVGKFILLCEQCHSQHHHYSLWYCAGFPFWDLHQGCERLSLGWGEGTVWSDRSKNLRMEFQKLFSP